MGPGSGADVDEVVGGAHGVLVVLHHDQGVAQVLQPLQGGQQLVVVPLVQADGRLVQDIQHPHEAAADLGGQADALAFAAGQGAAGPGQGQVAQAHGLQEAQPGADLLENLGGDELLGGGQGQGVEKFQLPVHRQLRGLHNGQVPYRYRQGLGPQAAALTRRARALGHELLDLPLAGVGLGFLIPALHVVGDALEGLIQGAPAPGLVIVQLQLLALGAVEDDVPHLLRQLGHRGLQGEVIGLGQGLEIHAADAVGADGVPPRGHDGPV